MKGYLITQTEVCSFEESHIVNAEISLYPYDAIKTFWEFVRGVVYSINPASAQDDREYIRTCQNCTVDYHRNKDNVIRRLVMVEDKRIRQFFEIKEIHIPEARNATIDINKASNMPTDFPKNTFDLSVDKDLARQISEDVNRNVINGVALKPGTLYTDNIIPNELKYKPPYCYNSQNSEVP